MVNDFLERYGRNVDLKVSFPANRQSALEAEECYLGDYPTLKTAEMVIGRGKVVAWLFAQLGYLNEMVGPERAMSEVQIYDLANTLYNEYNLFKFTEYMLFFHRLKAGYYGKFYGSVDPLQIAVAFREFAKGRNEEISRIEATRKQEKKEEFVITREVYEQLKERASKGDEEAIRLLKL